MPYLSTREFTLSVNSIRPVIIALKYPKPNIESFIIKLSSLYSRLTNIHLSTPINLAFSAAASKSSSLDIPKIEAISSSVTSLSKFAATLGSIDSSMIVSLVSLDNRFLASDIISITLCKSAGLAGSSWSF